MNGTNTADSTVTADWINAPGTASNADSGSGAGNGTGTDDVCAGTSIGASSALNSSGVDVMNERAANVFDGGLGASTLAGVGSGGGLEFGASGRAEDSSKAGAVAVSTKLSDFAETLGTSTGAGAVAGSALLVEVSSTSESSVPLSCSPPDALIVTGGESPMVIVVDLPSD
jgi:hypothetical protein